jgi:putative ABC transport system permease protein
LGLGVGQAFPVDGKTLTVSGVLAPTGSQDDQLAFTHLKTAQNLFDKGGRVSMVEVAALCNACPIDDMVGQISRVLPSAKVMAIQQVVKGRMETLAHFRKFSLGISAVVVLIAGLVVLVTLMGSVRERTDEIGIFRALGFRKRHVMGIIFLEVAMISILAGILGYAVGIGGTKIGVQLFSGIQASAVPLDWKLAAGSLLTALVIGLAASAYPASMAARLDPNEALRSL